MEASRMIPSKADGIWAKLVTGQAQFSLKSVPAGLMISRMQRQTKSDADPEVLRLCVEEAHAFFTKFEDILSEDIVNIFGQGAKNAH